MTGLEELRTAATEREPWKDGDERCHCTHCSGCGRLFRTEDHSEHEHACLVFRRALTESAEILIICRRDLILLENALNKLADNGCHIGVMGESDTCPIRPYDVIEFAKEF